MGSEVGPDTTSPEAEHAWREAASFAELRSLGERFVAGELDFFPGWFAGALDVESAPLVPVLRRLHRAGWLTLASQPGAIGHAAGGAADRQRAFVFGFVEPELARSLRALPPESEVLIRVFEPGDAGEEAIAVSEHAGHACVFAGEPAFEAEWEIFAAHCGPAALAELRARPFACAIDLCWGREGHLWRLLGGP